MSYEANRCIQYVINNNEVHRTKLSFLLPNPLDATYIHLIPSFLQPLRFLRSCVLSLNADFVILLLFILCICYIKKQNST